MKNILKHNEEKATEESHKLEHSFSQESVEIIEKLMEDKFEEPKKLMKPTPSYIG